MVVSLPGPLLAALSISKVSYVSHSHHTDTHGVRGRTNLISRKSPFKCVSGFSMKQRSRCQFDGRDDHENEAITPYCWQIYKQAFKYLIWGNMCPRSTPRGAESGKENSVSSLPVLKCLQSFLECSDLDPSRMRWFCGTDVDPAMVAQRRTGGPSEARAPERKSNSGRKGNVTRVYIRSRGALPPTLSSS